MKKYFDNCARPIFIAGQGLKGKHLETVKDFTDKHNILVIPTWGAVENFPYSPRFGISGSILGNKIVQAADLIVIIGSRLDSHHLGSKFNDQAKIIYIDIDKNELNKEYPVKFHKRLNKIPDFNFVTHRFVDWWIDSKLHQSVEIEDFPYKFIRALSKSLPKESVIIPDTGANLCITMQALNAKPGQRIFTDWNMATMGYSICASIGAYYACPDRPIICIIGDGGLQMNIQELETIAHLEIPIKIFVFNNNEYGIIKQTCDTWGLDKVGCDAETGLGFPDFIKVANAYGILTSLIATEEDFNKIPMILDSKNAILTVVKIAQNQRISPKLKAGERLEQIG